MTNLSNPVPTKHQPIETLAFQKPYSFHYNNTFDDKYLTNSLLRSWSIPTPNFIEFSNEDRLSTAWLNSHELDFPLVIKPKRGRGSYGVKVVHSFEQLEKACIDILSTGTKFILEEFLTGTELTVTVMPPGSYLIQGEIVEKDSHWALPAVERFNHINDIAPYNGTVAVIKNSRVVDHQSLQILQVLRHCESSARILEAHAPIRIDCRANQGGDFFLFDLNLKPNMTGVGRKGREEMNSLTALAAKSIGWEYEDMLVNILAQAWCFSRFNFRRLWILFLGL
jgi:D-alanine-D-alanine ligase